VQYNLPEDEADDHLIALIKAHGRWQEPSPGTPPGPAAAPATGGAEPAPGSSGVTESSLP
jgi:hypothetical protein